MSIVENIQIRLDNDELGAGVFADLRKVLDAMGHSILIQNLEFYGVRGISTKRFSCWQTDNSLCQIVTLIL